MKNYRGFIGSYTRKNSQGIRTFYFNENEFKIEDFYKVGNPTYLALDESGKFLYSSMSQEDTQGVMSMNLENKAVTSVLFKNESTPAHVSIFDKYLLASNYHDAHLDLYALDQNMVKARLDSKIHRGQGPNVVRQEKSHIHFAMKNPHNEDILVCDLGTDHVYIYQVKDHSLVKIGEIVFPGGSGPRHLAYAKFKNQVYVFSELTSEIFVLDYHNGQYHLIQSITTLPKDFIGENTGAAIRIRPDQKFLYVSNRGHDSISTFRIEEDGTLEMVSTISCYGDHPRDFNITPDGRYLLSAQMNSQDLTLFQIRKDTGELTLKQEKIQTPEPVSIIFLP